MADKQTQGPANSDLEEEARLEDALRRLTEAHLQASLFVPVSAPSCFLTLRLQLRHLRSALPRMLEPLRAKHATRESCPCRRLPSK